MVSLPRLLLTLAFVAAFVTLQEVAIPDTLPTSRSETPGTVRVASPLKVDNAQARGQADSRLSPYAAVGRFKGTMLCTAAMVLHPRIILTAAHCISERNGTIRLSKLSFRPGYRAGADLGQFKARVWAVGSKQSFTVQSTHDASHDWAILLLDRAPEGIRPFLLANLSPAGLRTIQQQVQLPSYSSNVAGGQLLGIDLACSVRDIIWHALLHDCKVSPGASGAPLLVHQAEWYAVAGINTGALLEFDVEQNTIKSVGNTATPVWNFAHPLRALVELLNSGKHLGGTRLPAY